MTLLVLVNPNAPCDIDHNMMFLDKVDPKFRVITDQLFFTDRTDIDVSDYAALLAKKPEHRSYLWDRVSRSTEIYWDESFWINRFNLILSLEDKKLEEDIDSLIMNRFRNFITRYHNPDPKMYNQYIHMLAWAKVRSERKDNVQPIKKLLLELPHLMSVDQLMQTVKQFVPFIVPSIEEYASILSKELGHSTRSFQVLKNLEAQGLALDKAPMLKTARDLLFKRVPNRPNRRSFFGMLEDKEVMAHLKSFYKPEHRDRLIELIKRCDYKEIEEYHLRNIKNLLELDASIADELMETYAVKLYSRYTGHKGANVKRLVRACKTFSQFSPKKVLAWLSANNKMSDIKIMLSSFPDLKNLAAF